MKIYLLLLAGGAAKRLWPYSSDKRGKQFIPLFSEGDKKNVSPIQKIYAQIKREFPSETVVVATSKEQQEAVKEHLGNEVITVVEPYKKDTFAAVVFSVLYIKEYLKASDEDVVVVLPTDAIVEPLYATKLRQMALAVKEKQLDIALMAIKPTSASPQFGYIIGSLKADQYIEVERFIEKPDQKQAEELVQSGAMVNGGVFAFSLGSLLKRAKSEFDIKNFEAMKQSYKNMMTNSFDYEVVEKAQKVGAVVYEGKWKDIGTWASLVEELHFKKESNQIKYNSHNTTVINDLGIPIVTVGVSDLIVVANREGILITNRFESNNVKEAVELLK
ncbi:MAG: sugar phosphate nucleotidyltransferase [Sphaerochaetaceae bacterium]